MKNKLFNLQENSTLYEDSAYIDYNYEQVCMDAESIKMMIARKSNKTTS